MAYSELDTNLRPTANNVRLARHREVQEITIHTDTREILANARKDTERYGFDKYFIVDVDAHHVELDSWAEILAHIEDPVLKFNAQATGPTREI